MYGTWRKGPGKWCPENDGAYQAEQAAIHALPDGKWCACGFPHEAGGPCWECRARDGEQSTIKSKEGQADG